MAAPKRNQFWKARAKHGRGKLFDSSQSLWAACEAYFEWVEANPLWEDKVFCQGGEVIHAEIHKMRPMTIAGLCIFLDIDQATWRRWTEDEDFCGVTTRVESIIRDQKFAGAAANIFNTNIIARDLGLVDKKDLKHDGGPLFRKAEELTDGELAIIAQGGNV